MYVRLDAPDRRTRTRQRHRRPTRIRQPRSV